MTSTPSKPEFWERSYEQGTIPWDLGAPTPIYQDLLQSGVLSPGRLIVLGAGRGHDARMFARAGYEVTAVDFSAAAAEAMRGLQDADYPIHVLQKDIFQLSRSLDGTFDYVLEYTCYCAIEPWRRPEYVDLVTRLLMPGGHYVALAFPLGDYEGGPPYAVSADSLIESLIDRGFSLKERKRPINSVSSRRNKEEFLLLEKQSLN